MSGATRISESLSNIVIMQVVINNQTIHNLNTISIHLSKKRKTSFFKYYFQPITDGMDFVSPHYCHMRYIAGVETKLGHNVVLSRHVVLFLKEISKSK